MRVDKSYVRACSDIARTRRYNKRHNRTHQGASLSQNNGYVEARGLTATLIFRFAAGRQARRFRRTCCAASHTGGIIAGGVASPRPGGDDGEASFDRQLSVGGLIDSSRARSTRTRARARLGESEASPLTCDTNEGGSRQMRGKTVQLLVRPLQKY